MPERGSSASGGSDGLCCLNVGRSFRRNPKGSQRPSLTRLDAVKQVLHAFINRSQAYDLPNEMGLVSFGDEVVIPCEPTAVLEDFRDMVDALAAKGNTKLWDAISEACTVLEKWKKSWLAKATKRVAQRRREKEATRGDETKEDEPILRLMVLSDGNDTKSTATAHAVCGRLEKVGVVVDSITVGTERNERLKCLSLATGGYAFHPKTLRASLRLNEQETVLSVLQRSRRLPANRTRRVSTERQLMTPERLSMPHDTEETAIPKEDPMIRSTCKPLADAIATFGSVDRINSSTSGSGGDGRKALNARGGRGGGDGVVHPERQRRVQREMMNWMRDPHEAIEVFPSDGDMHFWKVILTGPPDTLYSGGCWMLSVFFPNRYPSVAPKVRFVTPIRHCNINSHGRVCHALLDRSWTPGTSVKDVLSEVYGLLMCADDANPLDSTLALSMYDSEGDHQADIIQHVKAHASKPKRLMVTEIEAAGMSSKERLEASIESVQQAKDALAAGRLDHAKEKAELAAIFAAGGPAPIAGSPRAHDGLAHEAQLPGIKEARASACLVYARAMLEDPERKLTEVEGIANKARLYDGTSPEINGFLAEVAKRKWKMCDPKSLEGVNKLKEAITQQMVYVRMLENGTAERREAKKALNVLMKKVKKVAPADEAAAYY